MRDTKVIEIPKTVPARPSAVGTGGYRLSGTQGDATAVAARQIIDGATARIPIEIDKLYPADKSYVSGLIAALGILADAVGLLEQARAASKQDPVAADRYWQRFQVLLPELFTHRKIGDGYGAIINAIHFACINQHGIPPSFEQITTVWRIVKALRSAPVIPFEEALKCVQELEDGHLQVYPATISELIEEEPGDQEEELEDE